MNVQFYAREACIIVPLKDILNCPTYDYTYVYMHVYEHT